MADRNETVADIVAELREISKMSVCGYICQEQIAEYADRIEAAAKRESQTVTKCNVLGNAAKIREALAALVKYWDWGGYDAMRESRLKDEARAALAAPPRNCDIGTPEEQARRFELFCDGYKSGGEICVDCPLEANRPELCAMRWANMSYDDAEAHDAWNRRAGDQPQPKRRRDKRKCANFRFQTAATAHDWCAKYGPHYECLGAHGCQNYRETEAPVMQGDKEGCEK